MYIPNRAKVQAAFADTSSRPLLSEMERRFDAWERLRTLVSRLREEGFEPTPKWAAARLEEILDGSSEFPGDL